jgi:hypothetical protein
MAHDLDDGPQWFRVFHGPLLSMPSVRRVVPRSTGLWTRFHRGLLEHLKLRLVEKLRLDRFAVVQVLGLDTDTATTM